MGQILYPYCCEPLKPTIKEPVLAIFCNTRHLISIFALTLCLLTSGFASAEEEKGHEACANCHLNEKPGEMGASDALLLPQLELCLSCHKDRSADADHALGIKPGPQGSGKLPLVDGLISCTTCHDSHIKTKGLLRLSREQFCLACHKL